MQSLLEARYRMAARSATKKSPVWCWRRCSGPAHQALRFGLGRHRSAAQSYVLPPLLREQERVLGERDSVTMDDIKAMPVLERLALETERMAAVLSAGALGDARLFVRQVDDSGGLDRHDLAVAVAPLARGLARSRALRSRPLRAPREEHRRVNYSLITFGGGKHRCVGMSFGFLQVRVLMNYILQLRAVAGRRQSAAQHDQHGRRAEAPCLVRYRRRKSRVITSVPSRGVTWAAMNAKAGEPARAQPKAKAGVRSRTPIPLPRR